MGCEGEDWDLLFMGIVTVQRCTVLLNNEIINIHECIKCIYAELFTDCRQHIRVFLLVF